MKAAGCLLLFIWRQKPLFLCNEVDETIQPFVHHDDAVFIDELDSHTIKSMIHEMQLEKIHAGVFYHSSLEELKKLSLKIHPGGSGRRTGTKRKEEVLLIYRRGKWDLPKGKLDKGENWRIVP